MLKSFELYLAGGRKGLSVTVVGALAVMVFLNAAAVLTRSFGLGRLHWAHEVSLILAIGIYFISYGIVIRRHSEIRVEFLAKKLPGRVQSFLTVFGDLLQLGLYFLVGILGIQYASRISVLPMPMTRASQALMIVPLIVGFLDASIVILLRLLLRRQAEQVGGPSEETV